LVIGYRFIFIGLVYLCAALFGNLATVRRETGSWKYVAIMATYLFGLAYLMSFFTYQIASRIWG
jgi:Fe2+ transport system protein B